MNSVTDKDLDLKCKFSIIANENCKKYPKLNAMIVYFDVLFEKYISMESIKNDVILDTSPESECTHWYQTVFLLPAEWIIGSGEVLNVELYANRTEKNPREYDIVIGVAKEGKNSLWMRQLYSLTNDRLIDGTHS